MIFEFNPEVLHPELKFKAVRSGGKGGQNVNKVASKVELYFDVKHSLYLTDEQRQLILDKLSSHINKAGMLILESQEDRTQRRNREIVKKKFDDLIRKAFVKKKKRLKTKPSATAKAKRIDQKKKHGEKKQLRRKNFV